jgi:hypothetical protein
MAELAGSIRIWPAAQHAGLPSGLPGLEIVGQIIEANG